MVTECLREKYTFHKKYPQVFPGLPRCERKLTEFVSSVPLLNRDENGSDAFLSGPGLQLLRASVDF